MANEKRLIAANDALEVLCNYCGVEGCCPKGGCAEFQKISKLPAVEAVEVVHGHWISKGYKIECSACGHRAFLGTHDPVIHTEEKNICKYCPNCGAKMDGDGNG